MEAFQRAIEDEKKARLPPVYTGAGSLACGLTNSSYGLPVIEAEAHGYGTFDERRPGPQVSQRTPFFELCQQGFQPILITNFDALLHDAVAQVEGQHDIPVAQQRTTSGGFRRREMEWRRLNSGLLRRYENEWVVLEGEEIVSHNTNAAEAIREAKSRGIRTPYIFFVEPEANNIVRIGL